MSTSPALPPVRNLASPAPKRELIATPTAFSKGVVPTGFCRPPTFAAPVFLRFPKRLKHTFPRVLHERRVEPPPALACF